MNDVQFLFALLAGLYAWECLCWLRRGGVVFSTWTQCRWRDQHPAAMLGNQNGGFVLAAPLPPLGAIFTATQLPCSLGPEGVLFFVSPNVNPGWRPAQTSRFLRWDEIAVIKVRRKKILFNNAKLFTAPTPTFARQLHHTLVRISKLPADQRVSAIQETLRAMFDLKQIATLHRDFNQRARSIRLLANILFFAVFAIAPLLIWVLGLKTVWLGLLLVVLGLTVTTATLFNKLHRKFFPSADDDRFTHTLIIALAPATTMRAHDIASRPLLESFHPLAVARHLLDSETFSRFARRQLRDLRHPAAPTCPNAHPLAIATETFYRRSLLELVETWLKENHPAPGELDGPPAPADESCRAYCPRCEAQFTSTTGECTDCGGLALVAFENPVEPAPASD